MVEPIFEKTSFEVTAGKPATFTQASKGSGKRVTINFCAACGTKLYLDLERFPAVYGVYGGTFDDPNWFDRRPEITRHIFLDSAQHGTVIPAGVKTFRQHTMLNEGAPAAPTVFEGHHFI
ncbi:GFA family protein [Bradyrhizobium genosp. P]|uniref:GFA family protein n=1 Tax=Bradyrhizobium genosp. P TaxID=83641 RepID=UPI003CF9182B